MGPFKNLKLFVRYTLRLGAFKEGRRQAMTIDEARAHADRRYPATADDLAYETERRRRELRGAAKASIEEGMSPEEAIEESLKRMHGSNYEPPE